MSEIIERFRREHKTLLRVLKACKEDALDSNMCKTRAKIAHDLLMEHLDSEAVEIYEPLRREAEHDPRLKKILDASERDVDAIKAAAARFFEDCSTSAVRMDFVKHFSVFYILLKDKVANEESIVFPEYERLPGPGNSKRVAGRRRVIARPRAH